MLCTYLIYVSATFFTFHHVRSCGAVPTAKHRNGNPRKHQPLEITDKLSPSILDHSIYRMQDVSQIWPQCPVKIKSGCSFQAPPAANATANALGPPGHAIALALLLTHSSTASVMHACAQQHCSGQPYQALSDHSMHDSTRW